MALVRFWIESSVYSKSLYKSLHIIQEDKEEKNIYRIRLVTPQQCGRGCWECES